MPRETLDYARPGLTIDNIEGEHLQLNSPPRWVSTANYAIISLATGVIFVFCLISSIYVLRNGSATLPGVLFLLIGGTAMGFCAFGAMTQFISTLRAPSLQITMVFSAEGIWIHSSLDFGNTPVSHPYSAIRYLELRRRGWTLLLRRNFELTMHCIPLSGSNQISFSFPDEATRARLEYHMARLDGRVKAASPPPPARSSDRATA